MNSDLKIAQKTTLKPIQELVTALDIKNDEWEPYGHDKAKLSLQLLDRTKEKEDGAVILVTSINPTLAGEGKTTVSVGLGQAFYHLRKKAMVALREPSLGPVMGRKGGATGGGYAQVLPMEDINLHFTGDIHAITACHNALSAFIDHHLHQGNQLNINPQKIIWNRVMDMNDRSLRNIIIGLGGEKNGIPREDGFQISVASEIMAILCLATSYEDLKNRISKIVIGYNFDDQPITVRDLKVEGALTLLLKDAIKPNLVQTLEHTPALIHGGPFANIAHGCSSVLATKIAMKLSDYVITEAGFGADLGAEKFFHIKSLAGNLKPTAVVIVVTVQALQLHGADSTNQQQDKINLLKRGMEHLKKHMETIDFFGVPYVIAVNKFPTDTKEELLFIKNWCEREGVDVAITDVWAKGGEGGIALAEKIIEIDEHKQEPPSFQTVYEKEDPIDVKIQKIAQVVYGAEDISLSEKAKEQITFYTTQGWDKLPICIAKTQYSLSDNPNLLGRPTGFTITIRELMPAIGAGFIIALTGDILTMPGLPKRPAALQMDIEDGNPIGLF